jgi:hypothetical protein
MAGSPVTVPEKPVPHVCVVCKHRPDSYYGRLVFPEELASGEPINCPNHPEGQEQALLPA